MIRRKEIEEVFWEETSRNFTDKYGPDDGETLNFFSIPPELKSLVHKSRKKRRAYKNKKGISLYFIIQKIKDYKKTQKIAA